MPGRVLLICFASVSLLAAGSRDAAAQEGINREHEIKAAYLYQFARYVEWPPKAVEGDAFVIGVLGPDPLGSYLDKIAATKTVQEKKIVVRRFASAKDYRSCHILFISGGATEDGDRTKLEERLNAALEITKGSPVLLVSETVDFARKGAAINFLVDQEENRIKVEINRDAERLAGLKISSKLLGLEKSGVVKIVRN